MAKRALVTGACGFTGAHMVELLKQHGWDVTATDLERAAHATYYNEAGALHPIHDAGPLADLDLTFITADLTKPETLAPLFAGERYDVVFHVASMYDYFAEWEVLRRINVEGTRHLAEAAAGAGVGRFVHWSTDGVYGEIKNPPGTEEDPFDPPNLYSKSKVEQERVLWRLREERGLPLTVVRPAPIYGPRHRYGVYHILYGFQKIGTGLVPVWYPRRRTLMFPCVHVHDLVRAALFVAERPEAEGQAYNVLSDCITQTEFLEFAFRSLGLPYFHLPVWWPIYHAGARAAFAAVARLERRARRLGVRPKVDLPMAGYITHQYWFSNQKLKDAGFEFLYEDPRAGLWEYIAWCKERGWLE